MRISASELTISGDNMLRAVELLDELIAAFDSMQYQTSYETRLAEKLKEARRLLTSN